MDAGDSAAWTAAIVAIVAAVISLGMMAVAVWQARLAKRSAAVAEDDLAESRKQTTAAEQAAAAARQQAAEARRQNEIAEEQLRLAQEELETGQQRHQQEESTRHVDTVYKVLLAADKLRNELYDDATSVLEHQDRERPFGSGPQLILLGRAESAWDAAVNAIRVDKPPSPKVTAAIDGYDKYVQSASQAIEAAGDQAEKRRLSRSAAETLVALIKRRDDEYEALKGACDEFFAANGVNPDRLTVSDES